MHIETEGSTARHSEAAWESVAPGISCKVLAVDDERHRVSMLVRLEPGAEYPPHAHAGVEELHLLHGELGVDDRKLSPGDYHGGHAGRRVTRPPHAPARHPAPPSRDRSPRDPHITWRG